jgi:N-acetylneuraminic acid mutarotase
MLLVGWSNTADMTYARQWHTASTLTNGQMLVAGGMNASNTYRNNTELYDSSTWTWTTINNINIARYEHTASILTNGRVLVTGGVNDSGYLNSAELY